MLHGYDSYGGFRNLARSAGRFFAGCLSFGILAFCLFGSDFSVGITRAQDAESGSLASSEEAGKDSASGSAATEASISSGQTVSSEMVSASGAGTMPDGSVTDGSGVLSADAEKIDPVATESGARVDTASDLPVGVGEGAGSGAVSESESFSSLAAPSPQNGSSAYAPMVLLPSVPRDGLRLEYLFDGSATDTSGHANDPSLIENDTYDDSRFGRSVELGTDGIVQFTSSPTFDLATIRNATIAFWVRRTSKDVAYSVSGQQSTILGAFADVSSTYWLNYINDRRVYFKGGTGELCSNLLSEHICSTWTNYIDGQWHFVVQQVKDGSGSSFYVDGRLIGTGSVDYSQSYKIKYLRIYSSGWAPSVRVDNFRYYDRILSAAELDALRNEPFPPSCSDQIKNQNETDVDYGGTCGKLPTNGIVAQYEFEKSMLDSSPYANHLTPVSNVSYQSGFRGSSLAFSGYTYNPAVPSTATGSDSLRFGSGMTIGGWIYLENERQGTLFSRTDGSNAGAYFNASRYVPTRILIDGKVDPWNYFSNVLLANDAQRAWNYFVLSTDGKRVYVYYNGERVYAFKGAFPDRLPLASYYNAYSITLWQGKSVPTLNGRLDDVFVYDRALSPQEVSRLYSFVSKPPEFLTLAGSEPSDTATGVARLTPLSVSFAEEIDLSAVASKVRFRSIGSGGVASEVPVLVFLEPNRKTVSLKPRLSNEALSANSDYEIFVGSGLVSANGNVLSNDVRIRFRTGRANVVPNTFYDPYRYLYANTVLEWDAVDSARRDADLLASSVEKEQAAADPVDLRTGEFTYENAFMRLSGVGVPYEFGVYYRSQVESLGALGHGWLTSYERRLRERDDGTVTYFDERFGSHEFSPTGSGAYGYLAAYKASLSKTSTGFSLVFDDGRGMAFDLAGNMTRLSDPSGNALAFYYGSGGSLASVTDTLGRVISYVYRPDGLLSGISTQDRSLAFEYYDATSTGGMAGDLAVIRIRGGDAEKTVRFTSSRDESTPFSAHNVLTLSDARGNVYVENAYDADDRVLSQRYGTGTVTYAYTLGDIRADDTSTAAGTGTIIGHYVAINRATNRRGIITEHAYDRLWNAVSMSVFDPSDPARPAVTRYAYDANYRLVSETRPLGNGTKYTYDERGNRIEERKKADMAAPDDDTADIVSRYEYDRANDRLLKRTAPDGGVTEFSYDAHGRLVRTTRRGVRLSGLVQSGADLSVTYSYDAAGQLVRTVDALGHAVSISYDRGRPASVTREWSGANLVETYSYDAYGNPVSITDSAGNVRTMDYDDYDRLVASVSPEGIEKRLTYDENNNVVRESVRIGSGIERIATSAYDGLDHAVSISRSVSADVAAATSMTYDANGNIATLTLPNGVSKRYEYDASDRPTLVSVTASGTGGETLSTRYSYDANGNVIRETDDVGNERSYAYDPYGRVTRIVDALGGAWEYAYDKNGNVVRSVAKNASGAILEDRRTERNILGQILSEEIVSDGGNLRKTYVYDANGNVVSVIDERGNAVSYAYDGFGRPVGVTDAEWTILTIAYDERSLPVSRTVTGSGGKSVTTHTAYDRDGRLSRSWQVLDGRELATRYEYDAFGNVVRVVQPDGGLVLSEYDLLGRLLKETRTASGASSATSYGYDAVGNLLSVTDPNGNITRYEYDALGRLAREILSDGSVTERSYDALGRLATVRDPNGTLVTNLYDALGRLVRREIATGSGVLGTTLETYSYDALGRLVGAGDDLGQTLAFSYDAAGRLVSESQFDRTVLYGYDPTGNRTTLRYPGGLVLSSSYDRAGRLLSLSASGVDARYSYSGAELARIDYGNGTRTALLYDPLSRLSGIVHATATGVTATQSYAYDDENKLLSNGSGSYSYDPLDRLSRAIDSVTVDPVARSTVSNGAEYSYDPAGNRLSLERFSHVTRTVSVCKTVKANGVNAKVCNDEIRDSESSYVLDAYAPNALNQYLSDVRHPDMPNRDETAYAYDANGNVVSDGTYRYAYDYRNRLARVVRLSDSRVIETMAYDVLGRRTSRASNSTTVRAVYAWDRMIEEYTRLHTAPFSLLATYVWGERHSDDAVAMVRSEGTYYYHADRLGSVLALTSSAGATVERYSYDAYGVPSVWNDSLGRYRSMGDSRVWNVLLYAGRPYDRMTWLSDMRARRYSPGLGRFVSRDPIGIDGGVNLYAYAQNDPLDHTDRYGTSANEVIPERAWLDRLGDVADIVTSIDPTRFRRVFGGWAALWGAAAAVEFSPACAGAAAWAWAACFGIWAAAATTGWAGAVMAPGCFGAVSAAAVPCAPAIAWVGAALGWGYMAVQGGSSTDRNAGDGEMLGSNWPIIPSKTVWRGEGKARIDVENPAPGARPWQVHYQDSLNNKYYYDPNLNIFYIGTWTARVLAPKYIQELLKNPDFMNGIQKWLRYLNGL